MPRVDIVLTQDFPILSLTLISEPLRVANRESAEQVWRWRLLSTQGGRISSSSGFELDTEPLDEQPAEIVLLLSSYHPETALVKPLLTWLKRRARSGAIMGCVDTAALIFAEAGLLTHSAAAVHFEALRGFQEKFATDMFIDRLFDVSANRCSSAGGVATFDMTLGLIERNNGPRLAARVAEILTYRPSESNRRQQELLADSSLLRMDQNLAKAVDLMLASLDRPQPISSFAERVGVPSWTLARLFRRYLNQTPSSYYRYLRLSQARNLLRNSGLRVAEIAALCGFDNPESFSRAYRKTFGVMASADRM